MGSAFPFEPQPVQTPTISTKRKSWHLVLGVYPVREHEQLHHIQHSNRNVQTNIPL